MKHYLTPKELAKLESINHMTVLRWIHEGVFPNARNIGKLYRVPLEDYLRWRESTKLKRQTNVRTNERPDERTK